MEKNTNDVEDWEKRTPPSFDELKKKQKELEDKGVFKNNENKKEQVKPSEETQEMPRKLMKELETYCHTVSGYHSWLSQEHDETISFSQFMNIAEDDEEILAAIKKLLKELDRQKLLVILECVYELSGVGEIEQEQREKQKQYKMMMEKESATKS